MMPLRIEGWTRELAKDQPEYTPLCIRDDVIEGVQCMVSAWELTRSERDAVLAGGEFYVAFADRNGEAYPALKREITLPERVILHGNGTCVLAIAGRAHPPVWVGVLTPDECKSVTAPCSTFAAIGVRHADACFE